MVSDPVHDLVMAVRAVSLLAWLAVAIRMQPAVWRVVFSEPRGHDPIWTVFCCVALNYIGWNAKGLTFGTVPPSDLSASITVALNLMSAACAIACLWTRRAYKRGAS